MFRDADGLRNIGGTFKSSGPGRYIPWLNLHGSPRLQCPVIQNLHVIAELAAWVLGFFLMSGGFSGGVRDLSLRVTCVPKRPSRVRSVALLFRNRLLLCQCPCFHGSPFVSNP